MGSSETSISTPLPPPLPPPLSYWCYRCSRFVTPVTAEPSACPDCSGGFIEQISSPPHPPPPPTTFLRQSDLGLRRRSRLRHRNHTSPFNPVFLLPGDGHVSTEVSPASSSSFDLYYDDGAGSGLRPMRSTVSDFLLSSGIDQLLQQISEVAPPFTPPPAPKSAIQSMPQIFIAERHVSAEAHCAVCMEPFELNAPASEMPCNHVYHKDCIVPWLNLKNSCPVCREQLPDGNNSSLQSRSMQQTPAADVDDTLALTIWRLPGGGFAVGRYAGGRRPGGERELPVVYTEMDGGRFSALRRISLSSVGSGLRRQRLRESRGLHRVVTGFLSLFCGCFRGSASAPSSQIAAVSERRRWSSSGSSSSWGWTLVLKGSMVGITRW